MRKPEPRLQRKLLAWLLGPLLALLCWTAYAVGNSRWMARLPRVSAHDWSLLTGVVTGGFALLLAVHIGGCVGDLYDAGLYRFRFRRPDTLMQDTGPKQTFYVKQ